MVGLALVASLGWIVTWSRLRGIVPDPLEGRPTTTPSLTIHHDLAVWALDQPGSYLIGGPWGLAIVGADVREWPWPVLEIPPMPADAIPGWLAQRPIQPAPPWGEVEAFVQRCLD
jgi:hypothetical protein